MLVVCVRCGQEDEHTSQKPGAYAQASCACRCCVGMGTVGDGRGGGGGVPGPGLKMGGKPSPLQDMPTAGLP